MCKLQGHQRMLFPGTRSIDHPHASLCTGHGRILQSIVNCMGLGDIVIIGST